MNPVFVFGALALAACGSAAQPYQLSTSTIDGGGGTLTGTVHVLSGTIGQSDASGPMVGMTYELTGGFWGVPFAGCNDADLAAPFGLLDLADVLVFVTAFQAGNPTADFDGNALFDLADVVLFVNGFMAGCP